ncbi:MAG: hypothetical protein ACYC3S_06120 [Chloroflexota bacterium]
MDNSNATSKIGEIIEASTTEFVAESYELHWAPPLGALLRATDGPTEIYAVACHTRTGSIDPGRRPIARGRDDQDEDEIFRRHPELPQLLRTEFKALVVGFRDESGLRRYLPARPPRLHGFVFECHPDELIAFSERLDFLRTLLVAAPPVPADDLTAAFLRGAGAARSLHGADGRAFLVAAGKELARALGADPQRLNSVLLRMRV